MNSLIRVGTGHLSQILRINLLQPTLNKFTIFRRSNNKVNNLLFQSYPPKSLFPSTDSNFQQQRMFSTLMQHSIHPSNLSLSTHAALCHPVAYSPSEVIDPVYKYKPNELAEIADIVSSCYTSNSEEGIKVQVGPVFSGTLEKDPTVVEPKAIRLTILFLKTLSPTLKKLCSDLLEETDIGSYSEIPLVVSERQISAKFPSDVFDDPVAITSACWGILHQTGYGGILPGYVRGNNGKNYLLFHLYPHRKLIDLKHEKSHLWKEYGQKIKEALSEDDIIKSDLTP